MNDSKPLAPVPNPVTRLLQSKYLSALVSGEARSVPANPEQAELLSSLFAVQDGAKGCRDEHRHQAELMLRTFSFQGARGDSRLCATLA